jgi:hypothetical protein
MSMASDFPDLEQVPAGHDTLVHTPPEQLPTPVIRLSAEASVVKIDAGIDEPRIASATEANTAIIHFIDSSSLNAQCLKNTMLRQIRTLADSN